MKKFSIKLSPNYQRPVTKLYGMNALLDTGAVIPTFSFPIPTLKKLFNAKIVLENAEIKGFGGVCQGKICLLENFKIGELLFERLEVFVPNTPVTSHPFLLSASMFIGLSYKIDTINSELSFEIPDKEKLTRTFFIKDLKGKQLSQFINWDSET